MSGATLDYGFGTKNHWRRTVWNALLRRLNGRHRNEVIIYLAGAEDLDRAVAMSKGVPGYNLLAVERDNSAFARLRRAGVPAIHGDLFDVLLAWPDHYPVCAIHADYCCGLEWGNIGISDFLARPAFIGAVMSINMQRGRDPFSNSIRQLIEASGLLPSAADHKHRGWQLLAFNAIEELNQAVRGTAAKENANLHAKGAKESRGEWLRIGPELEPVLNRMINMRRPEYLSYKSATGVVMDTVIFNHIFKTFKDKGEPLPQEFLSAHFSELAEVEIPKNPALRRSISAQLAWRTMRSTA